ncbi:MAG: CRTAC1 family protein [Armatimonadota bacterium]|nr:CRTAC1 family protein [Armatimonadota bacterium]
MAFTLHGNRRQFFSQWARLLLAAGAGAVLPGCKPRKPSGTVISDPAAQPDDPAPLHLTQNPVVYKDVTASAGIHFQHVNGAGGHRYYAETLGAGCAFLDYDNDGWLDLFAVQSGPLPHVGSGRPSRNALYRNNRDGTFTDVTEQAGLGKNYGYGHGCSVADFDNDGFKDILVTGYGEIHLFRNNGNGTFTDVTQKAGLTQPPRSSAWSNSAAWADYNNDGHLDLFICHYIKWTPETDVNCPQPDGKPRGFCDPYVYPADTCVLYRNNGDGTFTDVSVKSGISKYKNKALSVAWFDYNGDGWEDIIVASDGTPGLLLRNNKDGTFTDVAAETGVAYGENGSIYNGMGIALGDVRHSGHEDLMVMNFSGQPKSVFFNNGDGTFQNATMSSRIGSTSLKVVGFGCALVDYDLDGWVDLVVANGHVNDLAPKYYVGVDYAEPKQLFHNNKDGTFTEDPASLGDMKALGVARGLAVGDYNNDGAPDFLVSQINGPLSLYENQGGAANEWITFRLEGVHCNRDAVGAKVWVHAGGMVQYAEVRSGSSYCSHSSERLSFGLGSAKKVDKVQVRWPRGKEETFGPFPSRAFYHIKEGGHSGPDPHLAPTRSLK